MDFIDGLPFSLGKRVIFVVVDRLSKAAHFMALQHPYTTLTVVQAFLILFLNFMVVQILSSVIGIKCF